MATKKPATKKRAATKKSAQSKKTTSTQTDRELTPYRPRHRPLANSGLDHHAEEAKRSAELQRERDQHNARTGDASL